ncbi:Fer-1-Like Protein 4 [Manis pentadactyla]|nr:Fer-1-Like Protein 4 [Manis pentadactyla]
MKWMNLGIQLRGGNNLMSVDGEAQEQGEPEVKDSMSQKKAVATLKIYISSLEEEFNHFEDWLNVFLCTKGMGARMEMERKKGLDPLWASSRAPSFTLHQRQCHSLSS